MRSKAAAAMMLGIGLAPVFFRSLFSWRLYFIVMFVVMETRRKPKIQGRIESKGSDPAIFYR